MWCRKGEVDIDIGDLGIARPIDSRDREYQIQHPCRLCSRDWMLQTALIGINPIVILTTQSDLTAEEVIECQMI